MGLFGGMAMLAAGLAGGCGSGGSGDGAANDGARDGGALSWYATCGDPVCRTDDGGHRPMPGVPACTTEAAGAPCAASGLQCDPQSPCNERLVCTDRDPKVQPGGCPISRLAAKVDLRYLDAAERRRVADELAAVRLARYRYREDAGGRTRLGFVIDDMPSGLAVDAERDRIDLYAYTSMVVAALQEQRAALAAQEREIQRLRAMMKRHGSTPGRARPGRHCP
jgi:hypothetical protein